MITNVFQYIDATIFYEYIPELLRISNVYNILI